jgi:DNA anti-recombination protein RmuC
MAAGNIVPFVDLRAALATARREGERLATTISHDVRALVARGRADVAADMRELQREMRSRANAAIRDLEVRGNKVVGVFERQLSKGAEVVLKRLSAATQSEIAALNRRVASLEKQLGVPSGARGSRPRRRRRA